MFATTTTASSNSFSIKFRCLVLFTLEVELTILNSSALRESGQNFTATIAETHPVPVSLSKTGHDDFIAILKELASEPTAEVQRFSALPAKLQQRTVGIWGLDSGEIHFD